MQGRTTSWDLGSLLIKPVQRVLKYPLLLKVCVCLDYLYLFKGTHTFSFIKEMLILVPPDHEGYEDLAAASQAMQKVADHLNEVKRRHDIVGHIVRDPGPQAIKPANKGAGKMIWLRRLVCTASHVFKISASSQLVTIARAVFWNANAPKRRARNYYSKNSKGANPCPHHNSIRHKTIKPHQKRQRWLITP